MSHFVLSGTSARWTSVHESSRLLQYKHPLLPIASILRRKQVARSRTWTQARLL